MSEFGRKGGSAENPRKKANEEVKLRRDEVARMEGEGPLHPDTPLKPVKRIRREAGPAIKQ